VARAALQSATSMKMFPSIALAACALASCSKVEPAPARQPNVILITIDTLRADYLGCYGAGAEASPRIDAFASASTRYANAVSVAPWTAPTHASLFTGLHPFEHGVHSFDVDRLARNVHVLDRRHTTLAEVLRDEGYATAAVVANTVYLADKFQLDQGFDVWDNRRIPAKRINRRALTWLEQEREQPFFLFLNYLDTHRPYNVTPLAGEEAFEQSNSGALLDELYEQVMVRDEPPGELAQRLRQYYRRAVRNVDLALGELIDQLKALGLYDDTVIVLTSDHGEYFGEHRLVEHSKDIYEEGVRVPLIVKGVGQTRAQVRDQLVSSVDVAAILMQELPSALAERHAPLFPYRPGEHPVVVENHYSRPKDLIHPGIGDRFRRVRTAVYAGDQKFVHSSDGKHELYDLAQDPDELVNAWSPALDLASFQAILERVEVKRAGRKAVPSAVEELDAAQRAELDALGYGGADDDE